MPKYLIQFAQVHEHFRIPELESVAELYGFKLGLEEEKDADRPYMVVELEKEEHVRLLARRCILIKSVYEYYAHGTTYSQLHSVNEQNRHLWTQYIQDTSFRFLITAYNHKIPQSRQRSIIENFSYMGFLGKIDMKTPEITLVCFEEYHDRSMLRRHKHEGDGEFRCLYFGKLLEEGSARGLIKRFDVKKRVYYGNTSMESEVSLLMANQTLASPGKLLYDPFMGTGSMAYPTTHFGAMIFGSDIDGRQMRGKPLPPSSSSSSNPKSPSTHPTGILRASHQYSTSHLILDLATFDVTLNPWRIGGIFDAIVTDPPYGVRAGAKRIGRVKPLEGWKRERFLAARGVGANDSEPQGGLDTPPPSVPVDPATTTNLSSPLPYIPPTRPYELSHLASDLVFLARYLLKPGGRLVFFLPTVNEEYESVDVEGLCAEEEERSESGEAGERVGEEGGEGREGEGDGDEEGVGKNGGCVGMQVIANSLQDFGSWGRRLVTIKKTTKKTYPPPKFVPVLSPKVVEGNEEGTEQQQQRVPAHKDFREKYFQGFRKPQQEREQDKDRSAE